jgi:hypothetical protein
MILVTWKEAGGFALINDETLKKHMEMTVWKRLVVNE